MPYRILPLTEGDLTEYFLHCLKVTGQSGVDGMPVFSPFDDRTPMKHGDTKEFATKFRIPTDQPGWRRTFGLFHKGQIVGDLDFYGSPLASALHRVKIGMGVQREHIGKGQGENLLRHSIDWAKTQSALEYIDLNVFSTNTPALNLYRKCGFKTLYVNNDAFRVRGQALDDICMSMKIR